MRIAYCLSVLLGIIALCLSAAAGDWTWTVLSVISMLVLFIPALSSKDFRKTYHEKIVMLFPIPYAAYIVLRCIDWASPLANFDVFSYIIQTFAAMVAGMMLMIAVNHIGSVKVSKRWILLFSIAFACTFSVFCMYVTYFTMVADGWPVQNSDFIDVDNTASNRHLMLPMFTAVFASLIYGYLFRCLFVKIPKTEINEFCEVK